MGAVRNALLAAGAAAAGWCILRLYAFVQSGGVADGEDMQDVGGNAGEDWRGAPWVAQEEDAVPAVDDLYPDELPNDRAARLQRQAAATARQVERNDNNEDNKMEEVDDEEDAMEEENGEHENIANVEENEHGENQGEVGNPPDANEAQEEQVVFDDDLYQREFSNDYAARHPGFIPGRRNPYADEWNRRHADKHLLPHHAEEGQPQLMRDNEGNVLPDPNRNPLYNEEHARIVDLLRNMDIPDNQAGGPPQMAPPVAIAVLRRGR
eukprot:TRINITY_DN40692_c0_g1_i2.p1 TRINITY_DN40692_c0_g1~~TRINITY_DN40692_c0_g1_i2.p1  ORF type:complete len:288 (+),score=104.15 TRINITY_DN40692_c0_g1_i2:67-864(+)